MSIISEHVDMAISAYYNPSVSKIHELINTCEKILESKENPGIVNIVTRKYLGLFGKIVDLPTLKRLLNLNLRAIANIAI